MYSDGIFGLNVSVKCQMVLKILLAYFCDEVIGKITFGPHPLAKAVLFGFCINSFVSSFVLSKARGNEAK